MKLQKALSSTGGEKKSGYRLNPFRSSSPVRKSGTGNTAEVTEGKESFLWELRKVTVFWGFLGGSVGKESACNVGDLRSIPGFGRSPGGGHGNSLQYSCLENPHGHRSYSPWGHKQLDRIERLITAQHCIHAWRISWTGQPGRLWSIGLQRVNMTEATQHGHHCHDQTSLSLPGDLGQPDASPSAEDPSTHLFFRSPLNTSKGLPDTNYTIVKLVMG